MFQQANNQRGLAQSLEMHRGEVQGYLAGKLGCADTAEDMFQAIVENLLRRDGAEPVGNLRAYLYQAARNALANHYRDTATRTRFTQDSAPEDDHSDLVPERILAGEQALARVNTALHELPLLTRQIFILYRLHGMKQSDIAARFDVHVSTVEKRLRQALRHCLAQLEE
ncbi:MAG: RNA polymerase sigma factor [Pseudomonadota bacterium]